MIVQKQLLFTLIIEMSLLCKKMRLNPDTELSLFFMCHHKEYLIVAYRDSVTLLNHSHQSTVKDMQLHKCRVFFDYFT